MLGGMADDRWMFEVYYSQPRNHEREARLTAQVISLGGRFDYWEDGTPEATYICLSYEFDALEQAECAATTLRQLGEHVEGPVPYGP